MVFGTMFRDDVVGVGDGVVGVRVGELVTEITNLITWVEKELRVMRWRHQVAVWCLAPW